MKAHSGAKTLLHTQSATDDAVLGLIERLEAFGELLKWHGGRPFAQHWPLIDEAVRALRTTTASAVGMEAREAGRNEPITPHTGEEPGLGDILAAALNGKITPDEAQALANTPSPTTPEDEG